MFGQHDREGRRNRTRGAGSGRRRGMMVAVIATATATAAAAGLLGGCGTAADDLRSLMPFDQPSPSEAASWMFHPEPERRREGISLISTSYFGSEPPYMAVYREAVTDLDPMVRAAAAHALALHGEPVDAPRLAALLADDSELVRWQAARGLQRIHEPAVVPSLLTALDEDPHLDVRIAVADALGQYAEPRVVEALIAALDDRALAVNANARRSLRLLTGEDHGFDPDDWLDWYREAEDPFAGRRTYRFPVYRRDPSLLERLIPLVRPVFEESTPPRGYPGDA